MKFFLFYLNFLLIIISADFFGQTTIISENFDSENLNGWSVFDGDMATPYNDDIVLQLPNAFHQVADYDSSNTGDLVMAATSWFNDSSSANNFLISPAISFSDSGNYMNFQAMSVDGSFPDGLQIYYAYNISDVGSLMANPLLFDTIAVPEVTLNLSLNLSNIPLDTTFHIVFRHYATNQYILTIDNVTIITNDATGITEKPENEILVYPNPSSGIINIHNIGYKEIAIIYNTIGKELWRGKIDNQVSLHFDSGIYLLKYNNKTTSFIIK
tara:strand:- start:465 stop:1274 length:810 start_codon:yes stop_codon:yes gene_type:complete